MAQTPRDTQFRYYSAMLCTELARTDPSEWPALVTRRAYDLMRHTLMHSTPTPTALPVTSIAATIPDMDRWPDDDEATFYAWLTTRPDPAVVEHALTPFRRRVRLQHGD